MPQEAGDGGKGLVDSLLFTTNPLLRGLKCTPRMRHRNKGSPRAENDDRGVMLDIVRRIAERWDATATARRRGIERGPAGEAPAIGTREGRLTVSSRNRSTDHASMTRC